MLQVNYIDAPLRDLSTKENIADERLGPSDARALRALISEAEAFFNAGELIEFREADLSTGDSFIVSFGVGCRAHFEPVNPKPSKQSRKPLDWTKVKVLMLVKIEP